MIQSRRAFIERYAPLWASRAAERRRSGTAPDLVIADILERSVAGMRAELTCLPADAVPTAPIGENDAVTWQSPVFHSAGYFDPFAGTRRDRMLASADVCAQVGAPDSARRYRALAETVGAAAPAAPTSVACPTPAHPKRPSRTGSWTGPAIPPPEPAPFIPGPQLQMAI